MRVQWSKSVFCVLSFAIALVGCSPLAPSSTSGPSVPSGLNVVSSTPWTISLAWNAVQGATAYTLDRAQTTVYDGASTAYTDTGLTPGDSYSYKVQESSQSGDSAFSSQVSGTAVGTIAWKTDSAGWYQYATNDSSQDGSSYFDLLGASGMTVNGTTDTKVKQLSGSITDFCGVVFGYIGSSSYYAFLIENAGWVWIQYYNGLSWQSLDEAQTSAIIQGTAVNDLSIAYDGTNLAFSINGTPVYTASGITGLAVTETGFFAEPGIGDSFPQTPVDFRFTQTQS